MIDFLLLNRYQLAAVALTIVFSLVVAFGLLMPPDLGDTTPVPFAVESGEGLAAIAQSLSDAGLIRSRFLFMLYVRANGDESRLQAGTYQFSRAQPLVGIARAIARGLADLDITVVIPEGSNLWEVDKRLADAGLITEGEFARAYLHKEGRLFPDTYRFAKEAALEDIFSKIEENDTKKVGVRSDIGGIRGVIIASLLEKEAKQPEDMAIIAGIIEKRLELGMPLQVDASVAYGWCLKEFQRRPSRDCDVTRAPIAAEISIDGPYNTYRRTGLPRGPVSNPGLVALQAAANPKESSYLFYLSSRDGGEIVYAETLAEHERNRAKYLGL